MHILIALICTSLVANCAAAPASQSIDARLRHAKKMFKNNHSGKPAPRKDGLIEIEGDILVTKEEEEEMKKATVEKRNALRNEATRWTDAIVKYQIAENSFSVLELARIDYAMKEWSRETCLKFENVGAAEGSKVFILSGSGCRSRVGMSSGSSQELSLGAGCVHHTVIIHELGHAIGMHHEQTRPDRDDFIDIHLENVQNGKEHNFDKYNWFYLNNFGIPYDYRSAMHYSSTAFAKDGTKTITTKNPAFENVIGKYIHLSFDDVKMANFMYKCSDKCAVKTCDGEGFMDKDCVCQCRAPINSQRVVTPCTTNLAPTTQPATQAPTTKQPATQAPTTKQPATQAPTTIQPATQAPTTKQPASTSDTSTWPTSTTAATSSTTISTTAGM